MSRAATRMIERVELPRRRGSRLDIAAVVDLVSGAVPASLVGAHRSDTAVRRGRRMPAP